MVEPTGPVRAKTSDFEPGTLLKGYRVPSKEKEIENS